MKRILFTGSGGSGYEAFYRFLKDKYELLFCDADINSVNSSIPNSRIHRIPFADEKGFRESIERLCIEREVDLLIPGVDEELTLLADLKNHKKFDVLLPPKKFIELHLNKLCSNQFLINNNLPAPKFIRADKGLLEFPCIIKPITGRGSRNVFLAQNEEEVNAQITLSRKKADEFIIQEFIEGQEYTVNISADKNGKIRGIVPILVNLKKGITISANLSHDNQVIEACEKIHKAYPVEGCYNIQLIKDANNIIKPFEINPRISTTSCLAIVSGIDFIENFLNTNNKVRGSFRGKISSNLNVSLNRFWYNNISIKNL